jgi:hypothetical protein
MALRKVGVSVVRLFSLTFAKFCVTMAAVPSPAVRLLQVPGYENRANDLAFVPVSSAEPSGRGDASTCGAAREEDDELVVYFGGDVQDWRENMEAHRDNGRFVEWNLEATGEMIAEKFPEVKGVIVVHPARLAF